MISAEDWAIACEAIRGDKGFFGRKLERVVENEILSKTWALQDGFGPGVPPEHWDWSGIRDSSDEAKLRIINEVKRILKKWSIEIPMDKVRVKVQEGQRIRQMMEAEMPELFRDEA